MSTGNVANLDPNTKIELTCMACEDVKWITYSGDPAPCFVCGREGVSLWKKAQSTMVDKLQPKSTGCVE